MSGNPRRWISFCEKIFEKIWFAGSNWPWLCILGLNSILHRSNSNFSSFNSRFFSFSWSSNSNLFCFASHIAFRSLSFSWSIACRFFSFSWNIACCFFSFSSFSQSRFYSLWKKSAFAFSDIFKHSTRILSLSIHLQSSYSPSSSCKSLFSTLKQNLNLSRTSPQMSQTLFGNPKGPVELGNPNTCAETKLCLNFILFRLEK